MVTASHCFNFGATIDSPGGDSFGTITKRDGWYTVSGQDLDCCSYSGDNFDFELLGGGSNHEGHYIYTQSLSGSPEVPVESGNDPTSAHTYCFSGATSWEHCGLSFENYGYYTPKSGEGTFYWFHLTGTALGSGACPGDSGSPIYRYLSDGNIQIAGMVNAENGSYPLTPAGIQDCRNNSTDVYGTNLVQITGEYGVTLLTISNDP